MNARTAMRLAALVLAALAACTKSPVTVTQGDGVMPADHPPVALPQSRLPPRRLDVDQLLASVTVVASDDGSIQWNQDKASIQRVLGKPDFVQVTDEDLSPSTLYLKFIDDLAQDVCTHRRCSSTSQVLMRSGGALDTLASNPTAVQQNLRYLYLRFFGRKVPDSDTTIFAPMLQVFDTVTTAEMTDKSLSKSTTPATEGWRAVCIAGFTSPDFNLY